MHPNHLLHDVAATRRVGRSWGHLRLGLVRVPAGLAAMPERGKGAAATKPLCGQRLLSRNSKDQRTSLPEGGITHLQRRLSHFKARAPADAFSNRVGGI